MINAKTIKGSIILDVAEVLSIKVPETGKGLRIQVRIGATVVDVPLNAKSLRKTIATIKANGPENYSMLITGRLRLGATPISFEDAAIIANLKRKIEEPAVPAEQIAA
jgi:hypothetical protein